MVWWMAGATARAELEPVRDTTGCGLDTVAVEEELRAAVGDAPVNRLSFAVDLSGTDPWVLQLTVEDHGKLVWDRQIDVRPADCPLLPNIAAMSFDAGLSTLPGWGLPTLPPAPDELGLELFLTGPDAVRMGAGVHYLLAPTRPLRWDVGLELQYSAVQPVDPVGSWQMSAATLATGPVLNLPVGDRAIRWTNRVCAGGVLVVAHDLREVATSGSPRLAVTSELGFAPTDFLRISARVERPITAIRVTVQDSAGIFHHDLESLLRVGLAVEMAGSFRARDVAGSGRP
jgi:hypothetical protein